MDNLILTQNEATAVAAGGILGGIAGFALGYILLFYILLVIANWKIFTKAGEAGWKSLIPIYNVYILCKIIKINFWIYMLLIPVVLGIITSIAGTKEPLVTIASLLTGCYSLFLDIWTAIRLGKSFHKGTGFIVGLVLLPGIFHLILGFGSSKYDKKALAEA
ncbi:hypothetical protein IKG02_00860 [Candidatus Saccharibacteria bacterium]|nr:hypothetical protein [Candidatus Saccharibacteria bacterium]